MSQPTPSSVPWLKREDTWAILIALALVAAATAAFFAGTSRLVSTTALAFPSWSEPAKVAAALRANPVAPLALFGVFLAAFSVASAVIGWNVVRYAAGFAVLLAFSIAVTILGSNESLKAWQLETPLLALLAGMLLGNAVPLGLWLSAKVFEAYWRAVG